MPKTLDYIGRISVPALPLSTAWLISVDTGKLLLATALSPSIVVWISQEMGGVRVENCLNFSAYRIPCIS